MVSGWLEVDSSSEARPNLRPCSAAQLRLHTREDVRLRKVLAAPCAVRHAYGNRRRHHLPIGGRSGFGRSVLFLTLSA